MIYDKIENLKLYFSLNPHFEEIADYADQLQRGDPASMTIPAPPALLTGKVKNLPF